MLCLTRSWRVLATFCKSWRALASDALLTPPRMLAVMTMNVGYFMSILGGTFLGSVVIGDWTATTAMHCDAH